MFDKFGEFDSVEELNRAAAAQLKEGDTEAVLALALENGIDREDAEDYIDGIVEELTTPLMAAMGKLEVESRELGLAGVLLDWKDGIVQLCMDSEEFSHAVRRKGRSLEGCLGKILKVSFEKKQQVDERICKAAGLRKGSNKAPVYMGIPDRSEVKKLTTEYYMEEGK